MPRMRMIGNMSRLMCANSRCSKSIADNKFSHIRASAAGWFFSREHDTAYCPKHVPRWVKAWRKKHAKR